MFTNTYILSKLYAELTCAWANKKRYALAKQNLLTPGLCRLCSMVVNSLSQAVKPHLCLLASETCLRISAGFSLANIHWPTLTANRTFNGNQTHWNRLPKLSFHDKMRICEWISSRWHFYKRSQPFKKPGANPFKITNEPREFNAKGEYCTTFT